MKLTLAHNRRGSLASFPALAATATWLTAMGVLAPVLVLIGPLSPWSMIGLGLVAGGALGNLTDRWLRGAVIDFIAVWRWPIINLGDAALCAGVALAAWSLL